MNNPALHIYVNNIDPTRTTGLRRLFVSDMTKRFRILRGLIRKAVVQEDVFGLKKEKSKIIAFINEDIGVNTFTPGDKAFDFPRSADKIDAFMNWLRQQENLTILERSQLGFGIEAAWTNKYIQSAYQTGIARARAELIGKNYEVPDIESSGGLNAVFNQPFHIDRVGVLYTRVFNELQGVTATMDTQMSRVLAQGIAEGRGPVELARSLNKTISGLGEDLSLVDSLGRFVPAERRAKMIARTEIIRAHHMATIQEYKNWGTTGLTIQAEWTTAGDGRVCEACQERAGRVYTITEIEGLIPLHPNCRCIALPVLQE